MSRRSLLVAIGSLVAATLFWAGNYVVGRIAVAQMSPFSLVYLRWLLALVPLLLIAWLLERPRWRQLVRHWRWLLALSGLGLAGYNFLLYAALQFTDAFSASLINAFNPALISLAAVVFLRQRLSPAAGAGIVLALAGVLIVLSNGNPAALFTGGFGAGQALILVVLLTPVAGLHGIEAPDTGAGVWSLLFIAVFPSLLSYICWNRALHTIEPAKAGVFLNLITVFTAIATVFLGHPLTAAQIIGGLTVLAGVALANEQAFTRPRVPHPADTSPAARSS